jgi:MGT family glycosyltransferase
MEDFYLHIHKEMPKLIEQVQKEKADAIVYDPMCIWGREVVQCLRLPAATFYTTFPQKNDFSFLDSLTDVNVSPEIEKTLQLLMKEEELNIVTIPKEFHPYSEHFNENYAFVGPLITERNTEIDIPLHKLKNNKVIYISMRSILSRSDLYKDYIEAFEDTSWQVVLNIGQVPVEQLGPLPSNFIVRSFVPQLEVLKYTDVFITHGGMNSVMESLWYQVPQIVIPQSPEQSIIAAQIKYLGLDEVLEEGQLNAQKISQTVQRFESDEQMERRLQANQKVMLDSGGVTQAVNRLQSFV